MLYLEDYLEMIEHLPSELRDRFTEMREMDLSVQNRVDSLEQRQKQFFANCKKLKVSERDEEFEKIRKEYEKVIEDSSEKIQNAEESYGLVDRYLRKLDQELHKFKMELEADNRGITEILEKRSLELDNQNSSATAKENRLPKKPRKNLTIAHPSSAGSSSMPMNFGFESMGTPSRGLTTQKSKNLFPFEPGTPMPGLDPLASPSLTPGGSNSGITYPLQHMGAGGNAIAAAASQAIAATQQLVPGRRTSSLKASYEAINLGVQTHEFSIGRELAGAAQSALAATAIAPASSADAGPAPKRQKVGKRQGGNIDPGTPGGVLDVGGRPSLVDDSFLEGGFATGSPSTEDLLQGGGGRSDATEQDWNFDPSEPRYCVCNQVSYGDMVACDNEDCPYEWFHMPCVGITAAPKGKWYCPTCLSRRKGSRK